jgi:hypothetical protein
MHGRQGFAGVADRSIQSLGPQALSMGSSNGIAEFIMGMPGIGLLSIPLLVGFLGAKTNRRLIACAPGIMSITAFALACAVSQFTAYGASLVGYVYMAVMLIALAFVVPAILALHNRALGFFHLLTLSGQVFLFFVGAMAISHDWL